MWGSRLAAETGGGGWGPSYRDGRWVPEGGPGYRRGLWDAGSRLPGRKAGTGGWSRLPTGTAGGGGSRSRGSGVLRPGAGPGRRAHEEAGGAERREAPRGALTILTMPRWTARGGAEPPCPGAAAEAMAGRGGTADGASADGADGARRERGREQRGGAGRGAGRRGGPAPPPGQRPTGGRPRRRLRPAPPLLGQWRRAAPPLRPERPPAAVTSREGPAPRREGRDFRGTRRQGHVGKGPPGLPTWPPAAPGAGPGGDTPP